MASWTDINPDWFLPGAPAIGVQVAAIADNVLAMGEGAADAQRIATKKIVGARASTGSSDFSGLAGYQGLYAVICPAGASVVSVSFANDGATFSGSISIDGGSVTTHLNVDFATGEYSSVVSDGTLNTGTVTIPANPTHIRLTTDSATSIMVIPNGGNSAS